MTAYSGPSHLARSKRALDRWLTLGIDRLVVAPYLNSCHPRPQHCSVIEVHPETLYTPIFRAPLFTKLRSQDDLLFKGERQTWD